MIQWFARLFRRTPARTIPPPGIPDSRATIKARDASEQMAAVEQRIDNAIAAIRERERQEDLRRIKRTGNWAEGYIVPERREGPT